MEKKHVKTLSSATLKESAAKGDVVNVKLLANQLAKLLVQLQIKSVKDNNL